MGSKQALSNGNEPEELTDLLTAFEQSANGKLLISVGVEMRNSRRELRIVAGVVPVEDDNLARGVWDCASAACWASDHKTLMGAITTLLYRLDFQLAELGWRAERTNS